MKKTEKIVEDYVWWRATKVIIMTILALAVLIGVYANYKSDKTSYYATCPTDDIAKYEPGTFGYVALGGESPPEYCSYADDVDLNNALQPYNKPEIIIQNAILYSFIAVIIYFVLRHIVMYIKFGRKV